MLPIIVDENINESKLSWLAEVWQMLTYQLDIPKTAGEKIYAEIIEKYSEPHRAYHNTSHLYSMLMMTEQFYDFVEGNILFELSIWFHDLIYDPQRSDNEEKSAERALELLSPFVSEEFLEKLNRMILSTQKHEPLIDHHDNKFFLDLDLAILSTEEKVYQQYTHAIRQEYKLFPDELYQAGRKTILGKFLEKENIYFTQFFQDSYGAAAKKNVAAEIETL